VNLSNNNFWYKNDIGKIYDVYLRKKDVYVIAEDYDSNIDLKRCIRICDTEKVVPKINKKQIKNKKSIS
jgi:hypothetical protein